MSEWQLKITQPWCRESSAWSLKHTHTHTLNLALAHTHTHSKLSVSRPIDHRWQIADNPRVLIRGPIRTYLHTHTHKHTYAHAHTHSKQLFLKQWVHNLSSSIQRCKIALLRYEKSGLEDILTSEKRRRSKGISNTIMFQFHRPALVHTGSLSPCHGSLG